MPAVTAAAPTALAVIIDEAFHAAPNAVARDRNPAPPPPWSTSSKGPHGTKCGPSPPAFSTACLAHFPPPNASPPHSLLLSVIGERSSAGETFWRARKRVTILPVTNRRTELVADHLPDACAIAARLRQCGIAAMAMPPAPRRDHLRAGAPASDGNRLASPTPARPSPVASPSVTISRRRVYSRLCGARALCCRCSPLVIRRSCACSARAASVARRVHALSCGRSPRARVHATDALRPVW